MLAWARLREAVTAPETWEMVSVPSLFATEETPVTNVPIFPFNFWIAEQIYTAKIQWKNKRVFATNTKLAFVYVVFNR